MAYHLGDLVRISGAWTNAAGTATDPAAVFAQYTTPTGVVTSLAYLIDAALVKDSTGNYHVDINANAVGTWYYRFYSTGSGQGANESYFVINRSEFD